MRNELMKEENYDNLDIPAGEKRELQRLIEELKEITERIEALDDREVSMNGRNEVSEDERRAINVSRTILLNQQKNIEKRITEILNNGTKILQMETTPQKKDHGYASLRAEVESPAGEGAGGLISEGIQLVPVERNVPSVKEKEHVKKPSFKFHVRSFKVCPNCGARVPANFRICGRCGTKLLNFCPYCGAQVPEGMAYCGKCGRRIF